MAYKGIKSVLGKSSLERKIRIWFGALMLALIAGSFWSVNLNTENLIRRNTKGQAHGLTSDFILRTHLENLQGTDAGAAALFTSLAGEPPSIPYKADVVVLDDQISRHQLNPIVSTNPREIRTLKKLIDEAKGLQRVQNEIEAVTAFELDKELHENKLAAIQPYVPDEDDDDPLYGEDLSDSQTYFYYVPLIFKSQTECFECHFPIAKDPQQFPRLADITNNLLPNANDSETEASLNLEKNSMVPPMFLRIELDTEIIQGAIERNRAILITVAIVTAVFSMGLLWVIVRWFIVKPLAHLRDVTEEVSHGRMDVRANVDTGDEFEELSRSFNRMLRHLMDTQTALQNANQDLDSKVDEQAQLNLKLYEMNQVKGEFLANMSHELRTPLNSIIGFSEILETAKGLGPKQVRFASNIRNSGRLLLDLINDILDLAKLEAGKMEVKPSSFKIHQLAGELCEMVRNLADSKTIKMVCEANEDWPEMEQDKIKVRQILTNLLSNAIKFTPEGGRVNVIAKRIGDIGNERLEIQVRDTGVGIAESDQAIVFEKFRQGPSALGGDALTREVSGTGLGLSIVKELCILLGGRVELESEVGKGSVFTVTIPWNFKQIPKINSEISQSIDAITKSQRVDFARANLTPKPPETKDNHGGSPEGNDDQLLGQTNPSPSVDT